MLSVRYQTITWTNADLLSIRPQVTYFIHILFEIQKFPFKQIHLNMALQNVSHFVISWGFYADQSNHNEMQCKSKQNQKEN